MSTLNGLKLVVSKKQLHASPIVIRRNKLISKLHEQIELCEAQREGKTYAPIRLKTFVNKTSGERMTAEVPKRVKEWFWVSNESNKINLCVKYGAKTLMLNKKTIQMNPELFKISGGKSRKNREKKELTLNSNVTPNNLKNKLLKRIKDHKTSSIVNNPNIKPMKQIKQNN
jgi:hypothetical protein